MITVLIITYNHENTIARAIESVLNQKTKFNFKVRIYDDASNDNTFKIIKKYVSNYSDRITLIRRRKNLGEKNQFYALHDIKTKYFAILDGDDYWCDENKLQIQIEILENNNDCSFCAHNTIIDYNNSYKKKYLNYCTQKFNAIQNNKKSFYIEPHISSRVYRTECLNFNELKNPQIIVKDIACNCYYLIKGKLFYIDKVMSVYNYNFNGIYSSKSSLLQRFLRSSIIYQINKEFNFSYDKLFFNLFYKILNSSCISYIKWLLSKNKDIYYLKELNKYKMKYLQENLKDIKPLFLLKIKILGKSFCLRCTRERNL